MKTKNIWFFTWLLLFVFSVTNAFPTRDIENLCNETLDAAFCKAQLLNDPRIPTVPLLSDVLIIVISLSRKQVQDGMIQIDSIRGNYENQKEIHQINICDINYLRAVERFNEAKDFTLKKTYTAVIVFAGDAKDNVSQCESELVKNRMQTPPLTLHNKNVSKLYEIIFVITKKLGVRV
ncbi:unnamed protein product [Thlaspi arvense]|uniref:Pectinesterase inhibitor domain-containing protein n=1 Tax=Thlaspi arvense TaxID=13288 RepID=A0AAU9SNL6_THLAR|nr:unnamed protein product [Thlaspi arvense]